MFRNDKIKRSWERIKANNHYIYSYIYNALIVHYNKRRIYFKNIYKTDLCDCLKKNRKRNTLIQYSWAYKRAGFKYPGGLISGIKYSLANGWAYIRGGLKPGGGLKVGFYGIYQRTQFFRSHQVAAILKLSACRHRKERDCAHFPALCRFVYNCTLFVF